MNRREFTAGILAGTGLASARWAHGAAIGPQAVETQRSVTNAAGTITDVAGIRVGHFTDHRRPTGCTVLLLDPGTVGGYDVRGGAAGTRGTESLNLIHPSEDLQALFLSGGSGFGLDVGTGVTRYLEEQGRGVHLAGAVVPLVAGAIIFDLEIGDQRIRPDAEAGYQAALAASSGPVAEGNVGAGAS